MRVIKCSALHELQDVSLMVPCVCAQHLPFFALSSRFFKNLYSTFYKATMVFDNALTKALISIQHYTFLPMMLVARFGEPLPIFMLGPKLTWSCAHLRCRSMCVC